MKRTLQIQKFALGAVLAMILCPTYDVLAQGAGRRQVLEGNRHYKEQRYDEANNSYRDALVDNPKSPIVHFDIADALYQKRKYEEALKSYDEAIKNGDEVNVQSQTYYNIGNTLYRLGKLPESVLAYQQALKLNPNDADAKFNLEYVRAKLKQEAQKQPQQQNQQNQQGQQNQQDQNNQQQDQDQQQQQQEQQQQDQQQNQQGKEQDQQQQQASAGDKQHELSKEDAARMLEALKNQEKEAQKARKQQVQGRVRVDKDW